MGISISILTAMATQSGDGGPSWQAIGGVIAVVLALTSIGVAIGAIRRDVDGDGKAIAAINGRIKELEENRVIDARADGGSTQRLLTLENAHTRSLNDVVAVEERLRVEMKGMESRIIENIDRIVDSQRREGTGPQRMADLVESPRPKR